MISRLSFRAKTILGIALIESVLLVTLIGSSLKFLHESNDQQLLERTETTLRVFANATKDAVVVTDLARLEGAIADILANKDIAYVQIKNDDNVVLAAGDKANYLSTHRKTDANIGTVDDGIFDRQFIIEEAGIVFGTLNMGIKTDSIQEIFNDALAWTVSIATLEILLVAIFSYLFGTYLSKGLSNLKLATLEISKKGPGHQIDVCTEDEIGQVTEAFNQMSAQLKSSYTELRTTLNERDEMLLRAERNWAKNQAILNCSQDAIITVDKESRVIDFNPAAERTFGWTAGEVKGKLMTDFLIPPELSAKHQQGMKHYLKTGTASVLNQRLQLEAMHKQGHRLPVEVTIADTSTPEGPLFTAFLRDMVQHIADQTELRLSAAAFETVEPMFITDTDAKIIRTNKAFTRVTGYAEADVIGKTPALWSSGCHDRSFYQYMWMNLTKRGSWSGEIYNRRKNGEIFPELLSISAVSDDSGKTTHYIAHLSDISEHKNREAALRAANQQARLAEEERARFLAVMSHEIRTPLNSVIGMLDVISETPLEPEQKELLHIGQESSWLLLSIINNILDFSKMEAGKLTLNNDSFDLHCALQRSVDMFRHEVEKKKLKLVLETSPKVPQQVFGDAYRLRQVLVNLIGNAVKFTEHGEIRVIADADLAPSDQLVLRVQVEDTGTGIPDDKFDLLFKEFSMIDQSHARLADGTGLGLVISKRLVGLMGGNISVTSQLGRGSCFSFSVQLHKDPLHGILPAQEQLLEPNRAIRILIAEDNPANQRVIESMLAGTTISQDLVVDGISAVEAVSSQYYDFVLMDISMPEMDGIAATKAIRELDGQAGKIPIIAMTAHGLTEDRERFLEAGMDDYLAKPMRKSDLMRVIKRWGDASRERPVAHPHGDESSNKQSGQPLHNDSPALVDERVLRQLVRDTSTEIIPELLNGYIDDSRLRVAKVIEARDAADCKQLEFEIHSLASSAAFHGNTRLYHHAKAIEELCRKKTYEEVLPKVQALQDLAEASFQGITEWINKGIEQGNDDAP